MQWCKEFHAEDTRSVTLWCSWNWQTPTFTYWELASCTKHM